MFVKDPTFRLFLNFTLSFVLLKKYSIIIMSEQNHNRTFSIIKAIGIILIVIGHSSIFTPLCRFVYLFHVTIFFFVAGYMFNDVEIQKPLNFFRKKIKRLYIPWIIYGIIFILLHNIFLKLHLLNLDAHTKILIEPYHFTDVIIKSLKVLTFFSWKEILLAPLWFLFGLFSGLSVFFTISFISKKIGKNNSEIFRFILVAIFMTIGFIEPPIKYLSILYRPFVIAGLIYLGKLYSIYEDKIKLSLPMALLCLSGLMIATYFKYNINVGAMIFGNKLIFLIISLAGCYMMLTISDYINKNSSKIAVYLDYIGGRTLSIMALHYLAFKLVSLIQIAIYEYPINYLAYYPVIPYKTSYWWVAYTIVGIIVPIVASVFYDKIIEFIKGKLSNTKVVAKM